VATWDGNKLTLYDKTQWVDNVQQQVAAAFGIDKDDVRVVSPFVGGAFGSALRAWVHVFIAALAARHVRRPVKLVLTRAQQYTVPGYRPHTVQTVALGATKDGQLTAIRHEATGKTSTFEEYTESTLNPTRFLYACPNVATRYLLAAMNVNTPASMRDGRLLVGWGMATATWPTHRLPATVLVRVLADGSAQVRTAASDIGPGTYTAMTQIAADALGLPAARVKFDLGDSKMPPAP